MKIDIFALIVFFMMGFNLCIPVIQKQFTDESSIMSVKADLDDIKGCSEGIIDGNVVYWENNYARLEVYPHTSAGIITQTQYANLIWKQSNNSIDVAFRFNDSIVNSDIWMWQNISHNVTVYEYGDVLLNYSLVNISDFEVLSETPEYIDLGDNTSVHYAYGNASFWDDLDGWWNDTFIVGFDSFAWLNVEHTEANFSYHYYGITRKHYEQQYWFDWNNVKDKFNHIEYGGKHYYFVSDISVKQNKAYQFKWEYDTPVNSKGNWYLLAKLHSDTIQEAFSNNRYVMLDPWWDSNWGYYKTCTLTNKRDDYVTKLIVGNSSGGDVHCEGHVGLSNFTDIRFVNLANDTEYYHWMENHTTDGQATFWINNSDNTSTILMYYGNSDCGNSTYKDGYETFLFFEDGSTAGDWTLGGGSGTLTDAGGGWLKHDSDSASTCNANLEIYNHTSDFYFETMFKKDDTDGNSLLSLNKAVTESAGIYTIYAIDAPEADIGTYDSAFRKFADQVNDYEYSYQIVYLFSNDSVHYVDFDGLDKGWWAWREFHGEIDWVNHIWSQCDDNDIVQYKNIRTRSYSVTEPSWNSFGGEVAIPEWVTLDTWNLTLGNLTISSFTIDTWNMTLGNMSVSPYILDTWNLTLSNTPSAYTLDTWNMTLGNMSISSYTLDTWNITLGNMSVTSFVIDTWNLTLNNLTISPFAIDIWNITLSNLTVSPYTLDIWNITIGNMSIVSFTIDTWNITLSNTPASYTLDTWNVTLSNTTLSYVLDTWNVTLSNTTDANQAPTQSNHLIWNGLTEKSLNATNVNVSSTSINFTVADPNGDAMDWYMYHNDSGTWRLIDSDTGVNNGTEVTTNTSWFRPITNYTISFNITDSANWTNATYWFVTDFSVPQFSNEDPTNGSIISVALYNWTINISDYTTFNWTINCSNGQNNSGNLSVNGTFHLNLTNLTASTYTVYVNATNGNLTNNEWYIFTYVPPSAVAGAPSGRGGADDDVISEPSVDVVTSTLITSGIFILATGLATIFITIFFRKKKKRK